MSPGNHDARILAPFGVLGIRVLDGYLTGIDFLSARTTLMRPKNALAEKVCHQLEAYIQNGRFLFDLPYRPLGTEFRLRVWQAMGRIPSGQTRTYGELARQLHSAPRAVGQACGDNPIPIVIPCHRVVGSKGLGGFMHKAGGHALNIKQWLLNHERA